MPQYNPPNQPVPTNDDTEMVARWNRDIMNAEIRSLLKEVKSEALGIKAERDRYEAALRKIATWKGYTEFEGELENDFERGANDMLAALQAIAAEALA